MEFSSTIHLKLQSIMVLNCHTIHVKLISLHFNSIFSFAFVPVPNKSYQSLHRKITMYFWCLCHVRRCVFLRHQSVAVVAKILWNEHVLWCSSVYRTILCWCGISFFNFHYYIIFATSIGFSSLFHAIAVVVVVVIAISLFQSILRRNRNVYVSFVCFGFCVLYQSRLRSTFSNMLNEHHDCMWGKHNINRIRRSEEKKQKDKSIKI